MHEHQAWKILLVDDDEDDYYLTRALLAGVHGTRYTLEWAPTYAAGRQALAVGGYDAVLMDYDLGSKNGLDLIREAAGEGRLDTPVILYTGRGGLEVDVQALEAGAILYLAKDEATSRLLDRSIRYAIERKAANDLLQQQKDELEDKNRQLEQLLAARQESEARYRSLFEGMNEGFALHELILDEAGQPADYRFLEINPAFERATGLNRQQVVGRLLSEILPSEDTRWIDVYAPVALTGQPVHFEEYSASLKKHYEIYAYRPAPMQFAVIFTDITERKLQDAQRQEMLARLSVAVALAESNQAQMEAILASHPDVLLIYDTGMVVRRTNPIFQSVYGYDPTGLHASQIVQRTNCRRLDGQPLVLEEQPTPRALRGERVSGMRFLVTRADGANGVVQTSSAPMLMGERITGSVTVWHDITEQARAEEWLHQSQERLRLALDESRRYAAQLEKLNIELQDFTFIASHDLQEPLRKVLTFGQRLHDRASGKLTAEEADYLDRMVNAAGRMQAMIQGLLAYSRVTTQAQVRTCVDLSKTAAEVLSDLEVSLESSQAQVEVGELPAVQGDPLQMRQLLQNLIGNAIKFARPGEPPRVRVWAQDLPAEAGAFGGDSLGGEAPACVQICVEDNGIGFDPSRLEKLFQPFQRLVSRTEYEGSGIGLAICRKIVERHGGSITARSTPGQGSTFVVTLPVE